ncbi:MAG: hypothetical protein GY822_14585 [Deltaproteobacteria bacterium]|nr:hypothetical protein [Deltaproteobacteria bacterium]
MSTVNNAPTTARPAAAKAKKDEPDNLFDAGAALAGAIFGEIGEAATEFGGEIVDDIKETTTAFKEEGLVGGMLELADTLSAGKRWVNELDALDVLPENEMLKEGLALAINVCSGNFLASIDNASDLFKMSDEANKSGKSVEATRPSGSMDVGSPEDNKPPVFQGRNPGYVVGHHRCREIMDITIIRNLPICICPPRWILEIGAGLMPEKTGGPVKDKPVGETSISDILNDKSLCFEDMLALVMMKIVSEQQDEIREKIAEMKGAGKSEETPETNVPSDGKVPNDGEVNGGPLGDIVNMLGGAKNAGGMLKMFGDFTTMLTPAISAVLVPAIGAALTATGVGTALIPFLPLIVPALVGATGGAISAGGDALSKSDLGKKSSTNSQVQSQEFSTGQTTTDAGNKESSSGDAAKDADSRALQMEELKLLTTAMSRMQQAMSNILNSMHQTSMNAIRNIK